MKGHLISLIKSVCSSPLGFSTWARGFLSGSAFICRGTPGLGFRGVDGTPSTAISAGEAVGGVQLINAFLPAGLLKQSLSMFNIVCPELYCFEIELYQDGVEETRDEIIGGHGATSS